MSRLPRINVSIEQDLFEALNNEAEESGRSVADVMRERLRVSVFGDHNEPPPRTIGEIAESFLRQNLPDEEVLARVLDAMPDAKTTRNSIAWYRSNLRKREESVPSQREARRLFDAGNGA